MTTNQGNADSLSAPFERVRLRSMGPDELQQHRAAAQNDTSANSNATGQPSRTEGRGGQRPAAIHKPTQSLYFNKPYKICSKSVKESRDKAIGSLKPLLGDDSNSWFAPGSRPSNLPKNPQDLSHTILDLLLDLAKLASGRLSQTNRLHVIYGYMQGRSLKEAVIEMHRDDAARIEQRECRERYRARVAELKKQHSEKRKNLEKEIATLKKEKRALQQRQESERQHNAAQVSGLQRVICSKDAQINQLQQHCVKLEAWKEEQSAEIEKIRNSVPRLVDEALKSRLAAMEARPTEEASR